MMRRDSFKNVIRSLPPSPGVYALIIRVRERVETTVGRLGLVTLEPGHYVYVGSARGPGGVRARIRRHLVKSKKLLWHIDYLTSLEQVSPRIVIYSVVPPGSGDKEKALAKALARRLTPCVRGFGSSDKGDYTHLFSCSPHGFLECIKLIDDAVRSLGLEPVLVSIDYPTYLLTI